MNIKLIIVIENSVNTVCAVIVTLVDELLSEDEATTPKVQGGLHRNGHTVSLSTTNRIARDLTFKWIKP